MITNASIHAPVVAATPGTAGAACGARAKPTTMKSPSGTSFATVKMFASPAPARTPRIFTTASPPMSAIISTARATGAVAPGQNSPR